MISDLLSAEQLAIIFHINYERLAPKYGYETREETKIFDNQTANGKLMIATCNEVLKTIQRMESEHLP